MDLFRHVPSRATHQTGSARSIYLIVTDFPPRRSKANPKSCPAYEYKDKAAGDLEIGDDRFTFWQERSQGRFGVAHVAQ